MAESRISPKLQQVEKLFEWYLEPLDIIHLIHDTKIFEPIGMLINRVTEMDDEGRKMRVQIFNEEWLERYSLDSPLQLQQLIDIFKKDERYSFMASLLGDEFSPEFFECLDRVPKVEYIKDILQSLMPQLQNIDATEVAEHMRRYLLENEREEIEKAVRFCSNANGVFRLLHKLICKQPGWIEPFIKAIRDLGYRTIDDGTSSNMSLADLLDDYCGFFLEHALEDKMVIEEGAGPSLKSSFLPNVGNCDGVTDPTLIKQHFKTEQASYQNCPPSTMADKSEPGLRGYQKELCKSANLGHNVVICAPTNSGKTVVAAHIIEQHLENDHGNPKVVFFTPTGGLAEQQFGKLKECLVNYKKKIAVIHGGMEETFDINHAKTIYNHDVIVMTPQILLNCLKNKTVHSLCDFTLIIFDECHHTRASHPYCEIMAMHLGMMNMHVTAQNELVSNIGILQSSIRPQLSLPDDAAGRRSQIVGLTATLGIGSADDKKQAMENMYMLLGMMDASGGLSMVMDPGNLDELHTHCPEASEDRKYIECKDDGFKMSLLEAASDISDLVKTINEALNLLTAYKSPIEEMGNEFEQWCRKLHTAAVGHYDAKTDGNNKSTMGRDATSCADTLLALIKVKRMTDNCDPLDAMAFLSSFIENRFTQEKEKNTNLENMLHDILNVAMTKLQDCIKEKTENEMLRGMIESIQAKEHEDHDFRCMVMVSRRLYADSLKNFVERSPLLQHLGCRMYIGIGTKSSSDTRGMTHKKQAEAIEAFKNGECKVLICTPDAAGEGIDIPNCNLVITIECISDEIKLVQLKGRARTKNSEVIHISFKKQADDRDMLPYRKLTMMWRTTRQIYKKFRQDPEAYKTELEAGRRRALLQNLEARKRKSNIRMKRHGSTDSLNCRKCSRAVCLLDEIVKINGYHHTVCKNGFQSMYTTRVHNQIGQEIRRTGMTKVNRILCSECKYDWGNEVEWKGRLVAILGVRGFKIRDHIKNKCHRPSKWSNMKIQNLTPRQTETLLASLPRADREDASVE